MEEYHGHRRLAGHLGVDHELVFELVDEEDVGDGDGDFIGHAFEKLGAESVMKMKGFWTAKRYGSDYGVPRHNRNKRFRFYIIVPVIGTEHF